MCVSLGQTSEKLEVRFRGQSLLERLVVRTGNAVEVGWRMDQSRKGDSRRGRILDLHMMADIRNF